MSDEKNDDKKDEKKLVHINTSGLEWMLWLTGWLFTMGYADLGFWKGVLALFLWPVLLGYALHG